MNPRLDLARSRTITTEPLTVVRGGRPGQIIFGGLIAAVSLSLLVAYLAGAEVRTPLPTWGTVCALGAMTLLGCLVALVRLGADLDPSRRSVTRWLGLPGPVMRWHHSIPWEARLTIERREGRRNVPTTFPVALELGDRSIELAGPEDHGKARQLAEQVSKLFVLPLHDSGGGTTVVREADALDVPLRPTRASRPRPLELPQPPAGSPLDPSVSSGHFEIELPGPRPSPLTGAMGIAAVVVAVVFGVVGSRMFPDTSTWLLFMPAALIALVVALEHALPSLERLELDADTLRLTRRHHGTTSRLEMPLAEIEELGQSAKPLPKTPGRGPVISVRSDALSVEFGGGLGAAERRWLEDVIARWLS